MWCEGLYLGEIFKGCGLFKYLRLTIIEDSKYKNGIMKRIAKGIIHNCILNGILWDKQIFNTIKVQVYKSLVKGV